MGLFEGFNTVKNIRQGDPLSWQYSEEMHRNGSIFYKSVQLLVYADDINIIRRSKLKRDLAVN